MWAFIGAGAKKFGGWIVGALSFAAMLATVWLSSRKVGKAEGQAEAAEERAADREAIAVRQVNEQREKSQREVEAIQGVNDVKNDISRMSDSDAIDSLRDEWSRD